MAARPEKGGVRGGRIENRKGKRKRKKKEKEKEKRKRKRKKKRKKKKKKTYHSNELFPLPNAQQSPPSTPNKKDSKTNQQAPLYKSTPPPSLQHDPTEVLEEDKKKKVFLFD